MMDLYDIDILNGVIGILKTLIFFIGTFSLVKNVDIVKIPRQSILYYV